MGRLTVIGERDALKIRRQWEREILPKVEGDSNVFKLVRDTFQRVSEGRLGQGSQSVATTKQSPKRDLAEKRRVFLEKFYQDRGLKVSVPKPAVSNREFAKRRKVNQELFYRPATSQVSYEQFMSAVGQGGHWTVTDQADRAKIAWEPTQTGYWFWAEVAADCPRLRTTWNSLNQEVRLLCLEEYVLVWHAHKVETNQLLDVRTWSWLRTRFGAGALVADGYDGRVHVLRYGAESLSIPCDDEGGRVAEVVKNAT